MKTLILGKEFIEFIGDIKIISCSSNYSILDGELSLEEKYNIIKE